MDMHSILLQKITYTDFLMEHVPYFRNFSSRDDFALIIHPQTFPDASSFLQDILNDKKVESLSLNLAGPVQRFEPSCITRAYDSFFQDFSRYLAERGVLITTLDRRTRLRDNIIFGIRDGVVLSLSCRIPSERVSCYQWVGEYPTGKTWAVYR